MDLLYQEPDTTNLLYEERLERAEQRRLLGNSLFAEGRYREALGKYAVVSQGACWIDHPALILSFVRPTSASSKPCRRTVMASSPGLGAG